MGEMAYLEVLFVNQGYTWELKNGASRQKYLQKVGDDGWRPALKRIS
jgi:hypothetical protein